MVFNWLKRAFWSTASPNSPENVGTQSATLPATTAAYSSREDAVYERSNAEQRPDEAAPQLAHREEKTVPAEVSVSGVSHNTMDGPSMKETPSKLPNSIPAPIVSQKDIETGGDTSVTNNTPGLTSMPVEDDRQEPRIHPMSNTGQTRSWDGWQKLIKLRSEVVTDRVAARESTKKFIDTVQAVSKLDSAFMDQIGRCLRGHDDLLTAFEGLRAARDGLRKEQLEMFQKHERVTIQSEARLMELEERVYRSGSRSPTESIREGLVFSDVNHEPPPSTISSGNIRADSSPEALRLLSQIGEVDLLRERLESMEIEYEKLLDEKELQELIGQDLNQHSERFIQNFDDEHATLLQQLKEAESIEAELRRAIPGIKVGPSPQVIIDAGRYSNSLPDRTQSVTGQEQYVEDDIAHAQSIKDPHLKAGAELFFNPEKQQFSVYEQVNLASDETRVDKTSYINAWLLHRVRTVPAEMDRLAHEYEEAGIAFSPDNLLTQWTTEDRELQANSKLEKLNKESHHESRHASVMTNNSRDVASKVPSDSQVPMDGQKSPLELQQGTRPPIVGP